MRNLWLFSSCISASSQSVLQCDRKIWNYCPILLTVLALSFPAFVQGAEVFTGTLAFDTESLDLDSGAVIDAALPGEEGGDIRIAYNALRSPSAVMVPEATEGVELSYLWGVAFDEVTVETVEGLTFSPEAVDEPFAAGDTIVVRTDSGVVFKIGNAFESDTGVTFDFSEL